MIVRRTYWVAAIVCANEAFDNTKFIFTHESERRRRNRSGLGSTNLNENVPNLRGIKHATRGPVLDNVKSDHLRVWIEPCQFETRRLRINENL